jgi:SAM-dependent methyltransferase
MRGSLLDHLACPSCGGRLAIVGSAAAEVVEGALACASCGASYPVVHGIPRFPTTADATLASVTARTQRTYSFTWMTFAEDQREKDSYRYTALIPPTLTSGAGKIGLDAGCGGGHDLRRMAAGGAEVIGFDLSDGVETAHRLTRHLPNVHVVQGDLNTPPFRPESFDFVYSFGVLHHLPDPTRGFRNLAHLLKPGGSLITYLYDDFGDRTAAERAALDAVRLGRRVTSRLPSPALYALCWLAAPVVWATCSVPASLLELVAPRLAGRIPFRHTVRWTVLASDLFDRFAPPVEWRFSREGVLALYRAAGLGDVTTCRYRGWVSWGCRPADVLVEDRA